MSEIRVHNLTYDKDVEGRRCNMIKVSTNITSIDLEEIDQDFEKRDETNYNLVFRSRQATVVVNLSEDDMRQIGMYVLCNIFNEDDLEEDERYVQVSIRQKKY